MSGCRHGIGWMAVLLVLGLAATGCAGGPASVATGDTDISGVPDVSDTAAPRVPEDVSNAVWEEAIARFEADDRINPPPRGAVLFIGSSSIVGWNSLATDFPGVTVLNRGFGGSELRDSTWYAGRVIVPYRPRQIVLYAGDNDLFSGRSPRQLLDDLRAFVGRVRRDLPDVAIAYISTKPSPSRAHLLDVQREANALIAAAAPELDVEYIDIFTPMLDADGAPRDDLFVDDRLHMNDAGYAIWREAVRPYLHADIGTMGAGGGHHR